jgi:phenylalanyl-tRNA synthetase alpha chain
MGGLPAEERPAVGRLANEIRGAVEKALQDKMSALQEEALRLRLSGEAIDVTIPGRPFPLGAKHPLKIVWDEAVDIFVGMGFQVARDLK